MNGTETARDWLQWLIMQRYNPFSPGSLVPTGVFTGRYEESVALERMLFNTRKGNPQHFLLHGERGIGKSSLLFIHESTASGRVDGWDDQKFNFLTVDAVLEPADTYDVIIRKIGTALRRKLAAHQSTKELAKAAWDFITRFEVAGVKYNNPAQRIAQSELLDELADLFATTTAGTEQTFDGILLLIDEADKPATDANLGALLKGFTERLVRKNSTRVCVGIAGVTGIVEKLRASHESSPRLFTSFELKPLSEAESVEVVQKGLAEANRKNQMQTSITPEAEGFIAFLSEGYPHFVQQFAYSAFEADTDGLIDKKDVKDGAWGKHGAFQQLGTKYFENLYFEQINSDDYRQVLRVMSEHFDMWVSKEEIRRQIPDVKSTTLKNAIKALSDRRIILPKPGQRGIYRLPTKSFAVWIRAYTALNPDLFSRVAPTVQEGQKLGASSD